MQGRDGFVGKTLGKCRILGRLGHGKTSRIFRAFYEPLQKEVAVKILREEQGASPELRRKFVNEARAIAKLDHENIVKVFDVVEDRGYLMIIMELLRGRDLYRIVEEEGPLPADQAVEVVIQTARALEAAHRAHIFHRDVKPQNLMLVGRRRQVKLVDFGLAAEGALAGKAGTPHFMSPEQIRGKKVDEKTDIYSLGATFFYLLTGRPPYPGRTRKEILDKHLAGKLPTPSRANRENPPPKVLDPIIKRMMAPVPGYRYEARALVETLEALHRGARGGARAAGRAAGRAARRPGRRGARRRSPVPLALAGLGVLAVVVVVVLLLTAGGRKRPRPAAAAAGTGPRTPPVAPLGRRNRENARRERERAATDLLARARSFESAHRGERDRIYARYKEVWDRYADTGAGAKARARMKEIEAEKNAEEHAAEIRAEKEKRRKARAALDEQIAKLEKAYDVRGLRKRLEAFMDEHGEEKDLIERFKRLEFAIRFLDTLAGEITRNGRKIPLREIRPHAPKGAVIQSADAGGLTIVDGSVEAREPWSYLTPGEIADLAGRQLNRRDPRQVFLLYAFLKEIGADREAAAKLDEARMVDRFGVVDQLLQQIRR